MTKYEQLRDNYEDALFALLMDDLAEQEGQRLLEENERLKTAPGADIPDNINKKCLQTIARIYKKERKRKFCRSACRVFRQAAVVAVIGMLLFTTAFAAFPEVRIKTLNLLIEVSDVTTSLSLVEENAGDSNSYGEKVFFGFRLPRCPDGFTVEHEGSTSFAAWIQFKNVDGAYIYCSIDDAEGSTLNLDTENADVVEDITISGFQGLLIEKDGRVNVAWGDTERNVLISVLTEGLERDFVVQYAEQIVFEGN